MSNKPPSPKALWLEQEVEELSIRTEPLRNMAHRLRSRMKRGALAFKVATVFYVFTLVVTIVEEKSEAVIWFRFANFFAFLLFLFFANYKRTAEVEWPLSIVSTSSSIVEYYKRQLEQRLEYLRGDYKDLVVFGFAGVVALGFALRNPAIGIAMGVLVAGFGFSKHRRNRRELPQVEQELAALRRYLQGL